MSDDRKLFLKDAAERLLWTFAQAFCASISVAAAFDLSVLKSAAIAGIAAVLSYVKSTLAVLSPDTISPASVVPTLPSGNPAVIDGQADEVNVGIAGPDGKVVAIVKGIRPQ